MWHLAESLAHSRFRLQKQQMDKRTALRRRVTFGGHFVHGDNSHCPQVLPWQRFVMNVSRNGKVKKLAYLARY